MRAPTFVTAAFGALLSASAAGFSADVESLPGEAPGERVIAQQCMKELRMFDEKLAKVGFGVMPPGGYSVAEPGGYYAWGVEGTPRQKIQSLRDAAYVYALNGDEQSCQMVLSSMRQIYRDHQMLVGSEADDPEARREWRRAHLSRSRPVAEMDHLLRADVLIGAEIRNLEDEKLGEIDDLVLNPEERNVLYVLVSHGGFLGFGERLIAIPWSEMRATEDHEIYVLDVPARALEDAPRVDRGNFEKTADPAWRRSFSAYWEGVLTR